MNTVSTLTRHLQARAAQPPRNAPVLPHAHRPVLRVLHSRSAPAQLALFLRPGATTR